MIMKKILCTIACLSVFAYAGKAQHYLGVATGQYNAINSLYINPSSISGCGEKIVVNLFSLNVGVDNNLGTFTQLSNISSGSTNTFNISGNQNFSMLVPVLDARLPSVLVSLNDKLKQSFAVTTRLRAFNQFNHFDPNLYSSITNGNHTAQENYVFQSSGFNWTAHVWSEIGVSYALQVMESGPHKINAGVTVRYLGGISYLGLKGKNLNVSYKSGNDTFHATQSDLEFASNAINSKSVVANGVQVSEVLNTIFNSRVGGGMGMDFGLTYTYRMGAEDEFGEQSANSLNGHKLKVSVAVTDIGAIKYNDANNFVVDVTGNGYLTGKDLAANIKEWNTFRNYMVGQGFTADTGNKATKVYMPSSLNAGIDYQVYKRFCVNASFFTNLANRLNYGNSYYSQVSITPRYDSRRLCIALPLTYSMLANDMKVGFGFRFAGFYMGSDDMMALLSNNQHGFGVYMGGYIPIYKKAAKAKPNTI